jgi:hypothetical protein
MSTRLLIGIALLLTTIVAGSASVAHAWPKSRLTALAARQDLSDKVCWDMALDRGHLSLAHRCDILADAKEILDAKEFEAFHRALDRLSPPPPKKLAALRPYQVTEPKSSSLTRLQAMQLSSKTPVAAPISGTAPAPAPAPETASGPVMPASATEPDPMAADRVVR